MSATQSLQSHLHCHILGVGLHLFIVEGGCNIYTSSTTDDKLSPVLGVEIEQYVAREGLGLHVVHAVHRGFLVGGDEALNRAVLQVVGFHNGHNRSHGHAVVGTEGRIRSIDPLAFYARADGVGLKVVVRGLGLLRHHVHVTLQRHGLAVFHARRGGFAHDDVAGIVLEGLNAFLGRPVEEELLHFFEMAGRTRHLREQVKVFPHLNRLQVFNFTHNINIVLVD